MELWGGCEGREVRPDQSRSGLQYLKDPLKGFLKGFLKDVLKGFLKGPLKDPLTGSLRILTFFSIS